MSHYVTAPRSPLFSPTLLSIPEVWEYEPLDGEQTSTANNMQDPHDALSPESSTIAQPRVSKATSRSAIIQSPLRRTVSALSVAKILRRLLEADLMKRRRIMRVYLKAMMFLKYVWRANERYGSVMITTGMYMRR